MFNKIILVGNLTRDIELIYTQSGTGIAKTAIATSRKYTSNGEKKEDVCFVDIAFFGRSAEIANQYLHKGSKVLVEGRLNFEQWVDQNGQKRSKHSVVVESMQMLDSRPADAGAPQGGGYAPQQAAPAQGYAAPQGQAPQVGGYAPQGQAPQAAPAQGYAAPQGQAPQAVPQQEVPVVDINEDEIPF